MIYYKESKHFKHRKHTIEGQLQMYERHPNKSERSSTLWHAWRQNKGWLSRLLELTLASFPSYSRHNASHAEAILYNIERILGEARIQELSATDCFAILHTVYVHDIGMAILASDREKIILSDAFADMVDELAGDTDIDLKRAAQQLKKRCYRKSEEKSVDFGGNDYYKEQQEIYREKLETYYAVITLVSEYQRRKHGEEAATRIKTWITDKDKLQSEFAMSGIPMRIFFRIADCASLHTDWEFKHIMKLPDEENGYDNDMLHPRFVAVLLQLGDALDIDNDRFHPFAQAFLGKFPMQSQAHYDKHLAIRTLKITTEEIVIEADCETREALRLIRNECDALETLLQFSSYYWSSIAPKGFGGALPSLKAPRLLLKGEAIPKDLTMMRFQISQRKAFSLLQGENIYSGFFPFVRELVQNAIDSTKIQCYLDYMSSSKFRYRGMQGKLIPSITNVSEIINPIEYPIEIEIQCAMQKPGNEWSTIEFDKIPESSNDNQKYGIVFTIRDYGVGIDAQTLKSISDVGTSYKRKKKIVRQMPDWLRPTGEFGIGLQSVFLIADQFFCETYVRNGERYGIEFQTGSNGDKGYINVVPKDNEKDRMSYGAEFKVFISHDKRKDRRDFMEAWPGYDPFSTGYNQEKIKRDIVELTTQILMDIDKQLEELLFPVYASVGFEIGKNYQKRLGKEILQHVVLDTWDNVGITDNKNQRYTEEELGKYTCWMYRCNQAKTELPYLKVYTLSNGMCMADLEKMQIYLWMEDISVSAKIGVGRIVERMSANKKKLCQVYYKGIWIEPLKIKNDAELIEYIDIQGHKSAKSLLQLNRNGFTQEGENYILESVVPIIFSTLFEALKLLVVQFEENEKQNVQDNKLTFPKVIKELLEDGLEQKREAKETAMTLKQRTMGISLFYHFYMLEKEKRDKESIYFSKKNTKTDELWGKTICILGEFMDERRRELRKSIDIIGSIRIDVALINPNEKRQFFVAETRDISVADFFNRNNKFIIISQRRYKGDRWLNRLYMLKEGLEKDIFTEIEKPAFHNDEIDSKKQYIEKWADAMLNNIGGNLDRYPAGQSEFLEMLMKYVPVIGCFSDYEGNTKVHILSGTALNKMVYNDDYKFMFLLKIIQRKHEFNAKRFASSLWEGYGILRMEKIQEDICDITEKYVNVNSSYMVFPYQGEEVEKIVSLLDKDDSMDLIVTGNVLEQCVNLEIEVAFEDPDMKDLFFNKLADYCKLVNRPVQPRTFWDKIRLAYEMELQKSFECFSEEKDLRVEDTRVKLGSVKEWEEFRDVLYGTILKLSEHFTIDYYESGSLDNSELCELLKRVSRYCWIWQRYRIVEDTKKFREKLLEIKTQAWDFSKERRNLIEWTAKMNGNDKEDIGECYDRLWQEMLEIVIARKEKAITNSFDETFWSKLQLLRVDSIERKNVEDECDE